MPPVIPPGGVSPAGAFVPQTFAVAGAPPGILADAIDPQTGEFLSISKGMDPIDSQVLDALVIVRASGASVQEDGQQFSSVRKVDDSTKALLESIARNATRRLVEQNDIRIDQIEVVIGDDWAELHFRYTNLRAKSNARRAATVPLL